MDPIDSKFLKKDDNKNKNLKKSYFVSFLNKILVCFILVITCLIFMRTNNSFKTFINKNIYVDNISFAYLNNLYNKYLGDILPSYKNEEAAPVFSEKLEYLNYNIYKDGYKLEVSDSYLVPIIQSGIVVFIGNIDGYGEVVIIEGIDSVDIWYGNIKNTGLKLYDYVSKGSYLGEVMNNNLYLVFEKNQGYLKFEDYIKN